MLCFLENFKKSSPWSQDKKKKIIRKGKTYKAKTVLVECLRNPYLWDVVCMRCEQTHHKEEPKNVPVRKSNIVYSFDVSSGTGLYFSNLPYRPKDTNGYHKNISLPY